MSHGQLSGDRAAFAASVFNDLMIKNETPESMGRTLFRYVLTNAAKDGKLNEAGELELSITFKIGVPDQSARYKYVKVCALTAFGVDLICSTYEVTETP